jgi:hypothetical protein
VVDVPGAIAVQNAKPEVASTSKAMYAGVKAWLVILAEAMVRPIRGGARICAIAFPAHFHRRDSTIFAQVKRGEVGDNTIGLDNLIPGDYPV